MTRIAGTHKENVNAGDIISINLAHFALVNECKMTTDGGKHLEHSD